MTPRFWRDAALPFVELRLIDDGRQVHYGAHSHAWFSVGAILAGQCLYHNAGQRRTIRRGTLVLMNPDEVHDCNPQDGQPWSYVMLYLDRQWMHEQQPLHGHSLLHFAQAWSEDQQLFDGLCQLYPRLLDPELSAADKSLAMSAYIQTLQQSIGLVPPAQVGDVRLARAVEFVRLHACSNLALDHIAEVAGLSVSHLARSFRRQLGMSPHAYQLNRRVQYAQDWLRQGMALADVAQLAGFADQAHFQRIFKRHLAATPGQYRRR